MTPLVSEIFTEFESASDRTAKKGVLIKHRDNYALQCVLRGAFNPGVRYIIDRIPPYKPAKSVPEGMGYTTINMELRRVYLYEKDHPRMPPRITPKRRDEILIQILEAMEVKEAKYFAGMLMKQLPVEGLDFQLVQEVFPKLVTP